MSSIISSIFSWQSAQIDGRTDVREVHTDNNGQTYVVDYMADIGYDMNVRLAVDAAQLNAQLSGE